MSEERPWEDYANPVAPPAAASAGGDGVDWEDVYKGAGGGVARGATALPGTFGTFGDIARAGFRKAGVPESALNVGAMVVKGLPLGSLLTGPSGADIQKAVEARTGKFYEPHTTAGQYASTLGEFAPAALVPGGGGIGARIFNTVAPAVASETAGQLTKDTAAEPYARFAAGLAGGVAAPRLITPAPPPTAARQAATAALDWYGVPLTAGERTGSQAVRWAEAVAGDMPLSSGAMQEFRQRQSGALADAVGSHMFDPTELARRGIPPDVHLPSPDVFAHGRQSLSDEYRRLTTGNQLRADPQLMQDLVRARDTYERMSLPSQRAGGAQDINAIYDDLVGNLVAGQGQMPGDVYQATRSRMGTLAKGQENRNATLGTALRDVRGSLDRAMERSLSPADAEAWRLNNERWANMKQMVPAVARGGEEMTPAMMAQAVRTGRAEQYAQGAGPLDELIRSASTVIKPMPSSGTAQRLGWQQLFGLPGMLSVGGGGVGSVFGPLGTAVGIAAPHLAARAIVSGPGQRYLSNQVVPRTTRDLLTQTLVQQAASQPSGVDRNTAAREAYERKRQQDLRASGL